jgi:hypothetical protein
VDRLLGRCIYCGSTENLTDEHVLPLALGGTDMLRDGSCLTCNAVTAEVESRVLNVCWKGLRWVTGMPTRHKKRQPTTMPAEVRRGGEWLEVDLPITEYTGTAGFPVFSEPAVLHTGQPDDLVVRSIFTVTGVAGGEDPSVSPATRARAKSYRVPVLYEPKAIARMVAKIAHGYAVDFFGLDAFVPYLTTAILGQTDDIGRWVGTPGGSLFGEPADRGHRIRVGTYEDTVGIIAGVHLFADAGTPEYLAVVGELHVPPGAPTR